MTLKVRFLPMDVCAEAHPGESLFEVAARVKVAVETACVGKGTCGLCRMKILAGEEHLSPPGDVDEKHLGNVYHLTKVRLSCQAMLRGGGGGDVVVELAPRRRRKKKRS